MRRFVLHIFGFVSLVLLVLGTTGCHSNDPDDPEATKEVNRTILVYMAACNSLGNADADANDIAEMLTAARNGDFNGGRLILYHAAVDGSTTLSEVTADSLVELCSYGADGLMSVNAERMKTVIADTKRLAPAKEYGLILWSHGDGWLQDGITEAETETSTASTAAKKSPSIKSFGQERGYKMNITTLAQVLNGQNFAFVYFDCCYMASVEVEYELRNVTPYIVASVSELPVNGMPYDENLRYLFADEADLVGAAQNTFNYYNTQSGFWRTCTMSVVRTSCLDALAAATRYIYEKADAPLIVGYQPQRYMTESTCYYYDLGGYIRAMASEEDYNNWKTALDNCIVYADATPSLWNLLSINSYCGLSTYIFSSEDDGIAAKKNYRALSWYDDVVSALFKTEGAEETDGTEEE
jgi:hypothetical protein